MRYADIIKNDFTAAPGVSVTLFVSGCSNHCPGCHNPELWDPKAGQEFTSNTVNEIIEALTANNITRTLCIMGGDPLYKDNIASIAGLLTIVAMEQPVKIWLWTGYTYEQIQEYDNSLINQLLSCVDVLVDGPYIQEQRDITLPYCGSRNQRVIDMNKTREKGEIVLWEN